MKNYMDDIKEVDDMSIVDQMYASFCRCAKGIPGFKVGQKEDVPYDITDLANGYVEAYDKGDQEGMNQYISALMVRYWHMVPYLYSQSKSSKLDMEDMVMWIWEGFNKAFKYRSWLDSDKAVSKDPKGAEKCFNQCITSVRQYWYRHFNTNAARINYVATSLDAMYEKMGDALDDGVPSEEMYNNCDTCKEIISALIKEGKLFDAIVIDKICFDESVKEIKNKKQISYIENEEEVIEEVNTYSYTLDTKKLIASLKSINDEYIVSFSRLYNINPDDVILTLKKNTRKNITNNINNVLTNLRNNKKVLSLLC